MAIAGLAISGCGASAQATPETVSGHGLTAELPAGWQQAAGKLTRLEDPREALSVGTFPLRYRQAGCYQMPSSALDDLGAGDALVTLQERGTDPKSSWPDFPQRPTHFGPTPGDTSSDAPACAPRGRFVSHWFRFTDAGRHFHVLVAFGPDASAATREQAWAILDSLRVDPAVRPDWESAG
jgi:hypothetical protein